MRYLSFLVLVFFLVCGSAEAQAAGWFDFLNPKVKQEGPDPAKTLIAPFADQDAVVDELDPTGNRDLAVPLNQRHRPNTEISKWVLEIVPTVLTYNSNGYEKEYAQNVKNFSKVGTKEYVEFLQKKNIVKTLKTRRYNVASIVEGYPVVINEGAVDGRYRWLYQVDVMVTYFDNSMKRYSLDKEDKSVTQKFVLTMQLGRVRGVDNEHGLLIETWNVKGTE